MRLEASQGASEMEKLLYQLLWSQLQSLGLFKEKHVVLTDLREQAGISTTYDRWFQESIALLERQQYLHCYGMPIQNGHATCTVSDPTLIDSVTLWQYWDQHKKQWMQNADLKAQVVLVETMLRALPAILTGKRSATEVMFPNGSMQLVEGIYQHNVIADSFNDVLARLLVTYLQDRLAHDKHARIRVLEIGAGTGGTTSRVLQMLQPYQASIAEYCYSDISEAFLRYGQRMHGAEYPYLTYQLFNVEKPLAGQGIELGGYDLVIATNVLHATSNIQRTVRNTKAALKKHGLLLLNEITGGGGDASTASIVTHLTFGLLSGWWAYEDPELRVPGCPALTAESWQAVLSSEGFGKIYFPTQEMQQTDAPHIFYSQQVIVAESDGFVRQPPAEVDPISANLKGDGRQGPVEKFQSLQDGTPPEAAESPMAGGAGLTPALGPIDACTLKFAPVRADPHLGLEPHTGSKPHTGSAQGAIPTADNTNKALREKGIAYLKELVAKMLNLPSTEIDAAEPLTSYGLDSILVLQLTEALRPGMEQISSTLFFEYATIDALVTHFLHTEKEALEHLVGLRMPAKQEDIQALDHPQLTQPKAQVSLQGTAGTLRRFLTEDDAAGTGDHKGGWGWPPSGEGTSPTSTQQHLDGRGQAPLLRVTSIPRSVDDELASSPDGGQPHPPLRSPVASSTERDIAIIGLTGLYPEAKDVQAFWDLLKAGKSAIREIPPARWDWRRNFQAEKGATSGATPAAQGTQATVYTKWGGFLEDIESFDASFFHISPREAEQMDPQERLFLEVSYACIEDAGYTPAGLQEHGSVGVFVGVMNGNYSTGAKYWSIANRVSFVLGLQGPSVAVDTACSSSLTALHFAVESLISGTCTCAIVGGVNLIVDPVHYVRLSQLGVLSASDECKSFGEEADGFVDGEGVGAVLLKPLRRAEADGDHIYGVIKATAINHGGKTNGYTVPNPQAQARVIEEALQRGAIDPRTISYVEAHGTGTELGDPIEIAGLARAFASYRASGKPEDPRTPVAQGTQAVDKQYCAIGSVKSNIGHTESAAGIAGITKVLLQMRYGQLVPSLHSEVLNPHIDFSATPFVVQQELSAWKRPLVEGSGGEGSGPIPRRAGISSFGAGGSNAHVILEEYVERPQANDGLQSVDGLQNVGAGLAPAQQSRPALIVLSARTKEQLHERVWQLLVWIQGRQWSETNPDPASPTGTEERRLAQDRRKARSLHDLAYTLQVGREAMEERLALQVSSQQELEEKLERYISDSENEEGEWYRGQVKSNDSMRAFVADKDGQNAIAAWVRKGLYERLLEWWVKGFTVDWMQLYAVEAAGAEAHTESAQGPVSTTLALPRRISLPTYPFAQERYWIPPVGMGSETRTGSAQGPIPTASARVALRPLTDQPKPSVSQSLSGQVGSGWGQASILQVSQLEEELVRSLAQSLYMAQGDVNVEKPFGEMGLDSVIGVEWVQSINKRYALNLQVSRIYDYPTIRQLAGFLEKELLKHQQTSVQWAREGGTGQSIVPVDMSSRSGGLAPLASPPSNLGRKEAIAIVGMSGKYPDAKNLSEYWDNLVQGKNAIREIPLSRFDVSEYYDPSPAALGKTYCKWLGALDEIEYFDPLFFHLSPAEAEVMDPQHRLFLEEGYKAFEDAGYSPGLLNNRKCGVYLGIMSHEYAQLLSAQKTLETDILGTNSAIAAARLAYHLNLKGPAIAVDTACSSSLVATHLACQALWNEEIDMALVGGVSLYLTPDSYVGMCAAGMLSPDGQCKTFDVSANGFVPGEGVGALVLKRLADAEADHDQIYGVIIGSGMNQDGTTNGITAPSVKSQIELEREIYEKYQIDPASISYVEMHGTGTQLGDPIELEALETVFQEKTQHKQYCAIGSVKSNIGHTSAAAGVAGLQKVLLAMKQKKLVPTLHFLHPNEHFDFEASPFYVNTEVQDWNTAAEGKPRRAAVSSFGFSGTNAHLVVEEYIAGGYQQNYHRDSALHPLGDPDDNLPRSTKTSILFVLSAKSKPQLKCYAQEMKGWIQAHRELALEDIAFTLLLGREAMDYRLAIVADSREVLLQRLEGFVNNQTSIGVYTTQVKTKARGITLFESDQDGQSLLHIWCQKRNLEKLAQIWVEGVNVDWRLLYAVETGSTQGTTIEVVGTRRDTDRGKPLSLRRLSACACPIATAPALPHRVSLPTYPFDRQRCWIPSTTHGNEFFPADRAEETRTLLLTPIWKVEAITSVHPLEDVPLSAVEQGPTPILVFLCDLPGFEASHIQAQLSSGGYCRELRVKNWSSSQPRRELRFQEAVIQLILELQNLLQARPAGLALAQVVVAHRAEPSFLEALTSVLKTAQQEYPLLWGQLIEIAGEPKEEEVLLFLRENQQMPPEAHVLYRDGKRWVRGWQEVGGKDTPRPNVTAECHIPWKEGGCYLISGGAGGLARLFVQEIARHVQKATVVLVGRSPLSREQRVQLEETVKRGIHLDYQQVDIGADRAGPYPVPCTAGVPGATDGTAVQALIQRVLAKFGHLDGIIHAAGVQRDRLLLNKTPEEVRAVLAPKVIGVERLDEASSQIPLDFFILCSSLSAVAGNVGQADYAGANAYLDAFAHARRAMVLAGERQGRTLSINWPLWEEGGMQVEAGVREMIQKRLGIEAMETEVGMQTLYKALACEQAQVTVLHGQVERIKQRLLRRSPDLPGGVKALRSASPGPLATNLGHESGQAQRTGSALASGLVPQAFGTIPTDKLHRALVHMVSDLLKVQVEEIDVETPLTEYGFDSISFTKLAKLLNQTYSGPIYQLDLTPPLFYEYSTIERLAKYLQTTYAAVLAPHFATASPEMVTWQAASDVVAPSEVYPTITETPAMHVSEQQEHTGAEPIAIIGMSGIFPQADDVQSLWHNLLEGRDCIGEIPAERWDWQTYFGNPATEVNKTNIKWAGVITGVETFDPLFFGISEAEAEHMDPQQRLLMMYVWKAIEDAGYAASSLSGTNTALFVGMTSSGYSELLSNAQMPIEGYSSTGLAPSVGPNRMSYFLNLHGPSEAIDTACSSSLVTIHRGVSAIESGQCGMAIVGGINTLISPTAHISLSKAGVLSEDGRCKSFSAQANGYVRGEGVGMLVLKKLVEAERDGDHIYGIIRSSAENHGGRASSLTAPNPRAQADLLIAAYRKAGVNPRTVGYIEAHGTGTALGDPIEINGLKTAFGELVQQTGKEHSPSIEEPILAATCGIGSVKSNIGHLELAAGVAGVIKVLLQLQHKVLVKSLHCEQLNPYIQLEGSPFYIVQENRTWEVQLDRTGNPLPRRAGVSSFGFGGTNAHVILEEYVERPQMSVPTAPPSGLALIMLSARTQEQLHKQAQQLLVWIQEETRAEEPMGQTQDQHEARSLRNLAYTLQVGRVAMEERLAMQVGSFAELEEKLRRYLSAGTHEKGGWYQGHIKGKNATDLFDLERNLKDTADYLISKRKYGKLLKLWVKGGTIDWKLLYTAGATESEQAGSDRTGTRPIRPLPLRVPTLPRRISLPTYPFAQERYWVETSERLIPCGRPSPHETLATPTGELTPGLTVEQPTPVAGLASASPETANPRREVWLDKLREALSQMVSRLLKVHVGEIDAKTPLAEYGFDSPAFTEFANRLNQAYQLDLTPAHLYEHSTLEHLTQHLYTTCATVLAPHFAGALPDMVTRQVAPGTSGEVPPVGAVGTASNGSGLRQPACASPTIGAVGTVPCACPMATGSPVMQGHAGAEPIAIIGMSGIFPQADDVQSLWHNLLAGRDCIGEIPQERWDWQTYFGNPADGVNKTNIKWAGVITGVETFDPLFFGISPHEAEHMDPQQRLLMMYVWKAIEDAGYAASSLSETNTALFVGTTSSGYIERLSLTDVPLEGYSSTGHAPSVGPNRMSYFLDLHGPSEPIETACSSSLVAIHRGVTAIESGQCGMAIVGGVNILVSPGVHISLSKAGMLAEDGHCKTFSAQANGYVRGEGLACSSSKSSPRLSEMGTIFMPSFAVVLKTMADVPVPSPLPIPKPRLTC